MQTLLLTTEDVRKVINIRAAIEAVEAAFLKYGQGEAIMPPKVYLTLNQFNGDFRAMPAYLDNAATLKWVSVYPDNPPKGLPTVIGTVIYSDPRTGFPLAIMDGTILTDFRTGAAAAVASKYLARKTSQTLGLVGCGALAQTHLNAIGELFHLAAVLVYNRSDERIDRFIENNPDYNIKKASLEQVSAADIVCTLTPATSPLVLNQWLKKGSHVNAMGADAPGKQELDPAVLRNSTVVVDELIQAGHGGEINVPLRQGLFKKEDIHATLGEIVAGTKKGREGTETTVFDSTGLAVQDVAVAKTVYDAARKQHIGRSVAFLT